MYILTRVIMKIKEDDIIKKIKYMKAEEYLFYASLFRVLLLNLKTNLLGK